MRNRDRDRAYRLVVWLAILIIPSTQAFGSVTLRNIPPTPHYAAAGTTLADIAATIRFAADTGAWSSIRETPNSIVARMRVRTHTATVTIGFDEKNYWIDYLDSENLDYNPKDRERTKTRPPMKGPRIHRNYNQWVQNLASRIEERMVNPRSAKPATVAPAPSPLMIADELEKLDALRRRGVLTQQEFDSQKAKLLAR